MVVVSMNNAGRMRMPVAAAICLLLLWITLCSFYNAVLADQQLAECGVDDHAPGL